MRQARLKVPSEAQAGYYHCVSRVLDQRLLFQDAHKKHFVSLMRECETFSGLGVLTYCVMSNHFHILLEVPRPPEANQRPDMDQVVGMVSQLSGHQNVEMLQEQLALAREGRNSGIETQLLEKYHARMWDMGAFMKLLKQRFTQWYNRQNQRKGTLWEERYKSVLVEGEQKALMAMGAYIDLNPVRAGLVTDPKDYRWSGYGEASRGGQEARKAREGIRLLMRGMEGKGQEWTVREAMDLYRAALYRKKDEGRKSAGERGRTSKRSLNQKTVKEVMARKERLKLGDYLRGRVRYFSDGAVLGSREYVEEIFQANRKRFGKKRKSGARRMKGLQEDFFVLRDLQLKVFG